MTRRHVRDGCESLRAASLDFAQHRAQVIAEFANFLIALLWIFGQRAIENRL